MIQLVDGWKDMIRLRSQASALPFNLIHWNGDVFTEDSYNTAVDFTVIDGVPMTVRVAMVDLKGRNGTCARV